MCIHRIQLRGWVQHLVQGWEQQLVRGWEQWTDIDIVQDGVGMRMACEVTEIKGDLVSFTLTFTSSAWSQPHLSYSTLRFLDKDSLNSSLAKAGLAIEQQFGDWDRSPLSDTSPEIITVARRA